MRLSISVPVVAYRGLWDKFGAPASLGAIRRAYLRDVACVLRVSESGNALDDVCALAANPAINRHGHALMLADDREPGAKLFPLYLYRDGGWLPCGVYVPIRTAPELGAADLHRVAAWEAPLVLVESSNVLEALDEAVLLNGLTDDEVLARVKALVPAGAQLARVSDYVELDFLERQQEAA